MSSKKPHSLDVLNDIRDYWWSPDFIALMAKRWELNRVKSMLDVGCGIGHWGQMLAPHLSQDFRITGIDPEEAWIKDATARAQQKGLTPYTSYQLGTAEAIPFPDNHFDMVTCQTVLIHVRDVSVSLKEMLRVLKPGGLLAVAEPNNLVSRLIFNNLNFSDPIDKIINHVRFDLTCERGRERMGKGNAFRGDIIPYYFYQANVSNIQVYISDLADFFIPPYSSPRERASLSGLYEDSKKYWDDLKSKFYEYFMAGGGTQSEFEADWNIVMENKNGIIQGYKNKTLCSTGGTMMYLVSGKK